MDLTNYEAPRVLVTCRSKLCLIKTIREKIIGTPREVLFRQTCFRWILDLDNWTENCILIHHMLGQQMELSGNETDIVPLYYHIVDDFKIQFGREEFCLVTGLRFGVEYSDEYDNDKAPIPFRRRVFPSSLDGKNIIGQTVEKLIESERFYRLHDDDAVSLCCVGIVQLVLLGVEGKRRVPNWILRLANDRVAWDKYPWGSYVWPTLYSQLRDANVKRWPSLYGTEPRRGVDKKTYSIFGFTWAFKAWILESFRVGANTYYERHMRYPRVVAWSSKGRFYRRMVHGFFHGRLPIERLTPDDNEARSEWWLSSRAYFDGVISVAERIPRYLNRQNFYEVPSEFYRDFEEQKRAVEEQKREVEEMMKKDAERQETYDQVSKFLETMKVDPMRQTSKGPIIVDQHCGLSNFSQFTSVQDGPSAFRTQANNSFFDGVPSYGQNMGTPNWQTPMPSHPEMMTSKDLIGSRKKEGDEPSAPPGFVSLTSFTLKRKRDREPEQNEAYSKTTDIEKLQKSFKQRPWILNDQLTNLEKSNTQHLNTNISVENTLPKGVIRGCPSCSNCQKVIACWRSEEGCRPPSVECTTVFHPTEEEFKDIYKYIEKIRPKAEENGICRINPPESWKPPFLMKGNKFDTTKFGTHVQEINALKDLHSKRKLNEIIEQKDGSDGFEFESGPEFTLPAFKRYAEQFKQKYFQKPDMFTDVGTPPWESVEGEYWRIIQNPTEEIQVLSGHNLEAKVLGSGFPLPTPDDHNDNQSKYRKSGWNLINTPKMPGSLLAFDCDNSTLSTPRMDVGMCFSSLCWKVEEHHLYLLSYMHLGSSRIWYGVPSKYHQKCEALLKKTFPELSGHRELFHKLVTQLSPSILKSEGIPVYRCVQNPKQFILIFPGAYYSGFDTGFSVSEKANFAPLDWLPHGQLTVETYSEMHRKTSISYDKLLLEGAREAAKSWDFETRGWNNACGKDGWLARALKSRVRRESFKRESLCNGSQSRTMEEDFGCSVKRECFLCFSDIYLSAAGCSCSPDKYSCLEHSKQICTCPWSSRFFLFRSSIGELNLLIDALNCKMNPK